MFNRQPHASGMSNSGDHETIIAQGVTVEGDFVSEGSVSIDGNVNGTVRAGSALRVGPSATIQANVSAGNAVIAGTITGNLQVTDMLELTETARIQGDVQATRLSVAVGATINGRLTMGESR